MYQRILVPVDGSATATAGLDEALELARLTGGRVRVLHVIDDLPFVLAGEGYGAASVDVLAMLKEGAQAVLKQGRERAESRGVEVDTVMSDGTRGRLCDQVAAQAQRWAADLIVIGTHGRRGIGRALLGSDAEQVLRVAPVPVLLVRQPDRPDTANA
jgi:nucleotide-binding universal stress UspA family protein